MKLDAARGKVDIERSRAWELVVLDWGHVVWSREAPNEPYWTRLRS